jgi:exonuclease V gamma subunit
VLIQLQRFIETKLLPSGDRFEIQQIPLNGFGEHCFYYSGVGLTSDLLARQTFLDRLAGCGFNDLWPQIAEKLNSPKVLAPYGYDELWQERVDKGKASRSKRDEDESSHENLGVIALDELRRFLLNPVQQIEKKQLGTVGRDFLQALHVEPDDAPLYAEYPFRWRMINEVLNRAVEKAFLDPGQTISQSDVNAILDAVYAGYLRQNRVPPAPFGAADKSELVATIFKGVANAQPLLEKISVDSVKHRRVVLGEVRYYDEPIIDSAYHLTFPATALTCQKECPQAGLTVTLKGSQDFLWLDQTQHWHILVTVATSNIGSKFPKQLLNAALFYLASQAGKVPLFEDSKGVYFYLAAANGLFRTKMTLNAGQAEKYLSRLIWEYTQSHHPCWLPWDVIQTFPRDRLRVNGIRRKTRRKPLLK